MTRVEKVSAIIGYVFMAFLIYYFYADRVYAYFTTEEPPDAITKMLTP